ncbi:MAG TPA: M48 family metallopeptidase, partial [Opitutaceae bacterium]|nr:M48 family metallopeptidase [Opitutaceae bacterium]
LSVGGVLALVAVIRAMVSVFQPAEFRVIGRKVTPEEQPALWAVVREVCQQLNAVPPDNIIVGLEPSFYVTESEVTCTDGTLQGRTLFVSSTMNRVLTPDEFKGIIGHEMAHFIGEDTIFSRRFFPVYRGTLTALHNLQQNAVHGSIAIAQMPAVMFLVYFYESFVTSEKNLSRLREVEADAVGAKVGGAESFATALVKVHAYSDGWQKILEDVHYNNEALRTETNLARPFVERARATPPEEMAKVGESHVFHPADSHPALAVRLATLQTELSKVVPVTTLPAPADSAAALISGIDELETAQTEEFRRLVRPAA